MRQRIAAILSVVGHPFVIAPLTVALQVRPLKVALAIVTAMIGALLAVLIWRVSSGRWSDYDVSDPQQRHSFYPIALVIVSTSTIASWVLHMPSAFVRGMILATALLAVGALLTRYTKVSLHLMIGTFCAATLAQSEVLAAILLGVLVVAVAWSRVALRRHTISQVCIGASLGCVFGLVLFVWR